MLAELNTHRVFSRNSASSRAIPVAKQIEKVRKQTAFPVQFGTYQKGMQAGPPLQGKTLTEAEIIWQKAAADAAKWAEKLVELNVHKEVANRLLEPFLYHKVIVTSTEWDNFLEQRDSPLAQPEMQVLACKVKEALNGAQATYIGNNDWHLPYVTESEKQYFKPEVQRMLSVARCARVSYLTHDGEPNWEADLSLYDRLASAEPPHWSPFEHVATPDSSNINRLGLPVVGNLTGWLQLRHFSKREALKET